MILAALTLCLTLDGQPAVFVDLADNPIQAGTQRVEFSPADRERVGVELRARGYAEEVIRLAVQGPYRLLPYAEPAPAKLACGTCFVGFWYRGGCWPKQYDTSSPFCLRCMAPCEPDPMPIARVR